MKAFKYFFSLSVLLPLVFMGCKKETFDDTSFVDGASAPGELGLMFDITQDNTGLVTITPNGNGGVSYDIFFGDGTTNPAVVNAGKSTTHIYKEGVYNVKVVGHNVTGKTAEATKQLTVSFRAPENLVVQVETDPSNRFKVNVSASALYETNFKVYYGDVPNEIPVSFLEGQTISHTYKSVGTYTVRVVAFSGGAATKEATKVITIVDPVLLPLDFESPTLAYTFSNFDGGVITVIDNPQKNGINTSNKVGKMVKNAGQPWGGSVINTDAPIDFSVNKIFRMKVFSPRVGARVLLKVENVSDASINYEKEVTTTVANSWEDLVIDYAGINTSNNYQKIILIFDNGTAGDGSANFTFLFDDIRLTNTIPSSLLTLPVTFDDPSASYVVTDFGGNISVAAVDPVNANNKVKKTTKPSGAETWAGTTMGAGFSPALAFTAGSAKMSVKVYAPAAGIPVRLKVEDKNDNTHSVETEATTTVANGWETLVFDFANQVSGTKALNLAYTYNLASIFFDFGKAGSGKVFYWDDVQLVSGSAPGVGLPLNFESANLTYAFTDFDGGVVTVINNPKPGGINTSSKVGQMVKSTGQPWGGSWIPLAAPIDFSTSTTFKMKVYSPRAGAKVLLKVENKTDGSVSYEKEVSTTVANGWEELTFDFSAINKSKSYQKIVLIFDNGTMGDGSANFTFLFDDIRLN